MNSFLKQNKIKAKNVNQEVSVASSKQTQSKTKASQDQPQKLKQASIVSSSFDKSGKSSNISRYKNAGQVNSSQAGSITFNNKNIISIQQQNEQLKPYPNVSIIGTGAASIMNTSHSNLPTR